MYCKDLKYWGSSLREKKKRLTQIMLITAVFWSPVISNILNHKMIEKSTFPIFMIIIRLKGLPVSLCFSSLLTF